MVSGFLIQTVSPKSDVVPTLCYWEPYSFVAKQLQNNSLETNENEKQALNYVLTRVQSEYSFRKEVAETNRNADDHEEESAKDKNETGIFRIRGYDFLSAESRVLWRTCFGCAFVLLLSSSDNIPLAELVLSHVAGYVLNTLDLAEEGVKQIITHPEVIAAVTHVFLPAGQLMLMNHRVVKQLEKDLDKILAGKV